jgi:hypothetical protein
MDVGVRISAALLDIGMYTPLGEGGIPGAVVVQPPRLANLLVALEGTSSLTSPAAGR